MRGMKPDAVVIVATVKALKYNGGVPKTELSAGEPYRTGEGHSQPVKARGEHHPGVRPALPWWPSTGSPTDTDAELNLISGEVRRSTGVNVAMSEVWGKGSEGGLELADEVLRLCEQAPRFPLCL